MRHMENKETTEWKHPSSEYKIGDIISREDIAVKVRQMELSDFEKEFGGEGIFFASAIPEIRIGYWATPR